MCGIAGLVGRRADASEALARALAALRHRGPDDHGAYLGDGAALGQRRLSIIDLAGGHQPIANEDRTRWIVCNGEIYNYRELREDLVRKGHRFATGSDTEVILHLYEEYGERCLERLRGMFAFAIWDEGRRTPVRRPRPPRAEAAVLRPARRRALVRLRDQGPAGDRPRASPSPTSRRCTSTWRSG